MHTRWISVGCGGLLVAAVVIALQPRPVQAVQAAGGVGVVDVVQVFNEYARQRDLTLQMEQIQTTLDAENTSRRQRIEALQTAISTMQPTDPTYDQRRDELMRMQIDYKNWVDLKQAQMTREVSRWSGRIYEEILAAVASVAQTSAVDLVLYKDEFLPQIENPEAMREQIRARKVLYASTNVDLTQRVLERLNQQYNSQPKSQMINIQP
jgi:Skp family chaperone for outer membrane proteins